MDNQKPLDPDSLYHACDLAQFEFETTADLPPFDEPLGQQRALEAIEFGVDIDREGFNLFVLGSPGLGKHQLVKQVLERREHSGQPLSDWCYVNNFDNPQKPKILRLPVGMGKKLSKDMETLIEDLLTALPSSFQSEEYRTRRQEIEDELQERQEQAFKKLSKDAKEHNIAVMRTPTGYTLAPVIDDKPIGPEEYQKLSGDEREHIEKLIAEIQLDLQKIVRDMPLLQREHHQRIKALHREITQHTVEQLIAWIENAYHEQAEIVEYLATVKKNAIENVEDFLPHTDNTGRENVARRVAEFHEYAINVIVDNTETKNFPVVFEDNPTYQNLIGRVEYLARMGALVTDFTLIKSGALHQANGGYLVLDVQKVLTHGFAWEGLKRALKAGEIKLQSLEQLLSLASTLSLEPESVPLKVKVILTGEPILYYLLKEYDHEFSQLFKVAADFSRVTDRNDGNSLLYARLIASVQSRNGTRPLSRDGVGRMIEHASRMADDSQKLSLNMDSMNDLMHEADYWAGKEDSEVICLQHVEKAIEQRLYRQDKLRELMQEQITRGIKLIDTSGEKVGQVNGLSVLQIGDYSFGQPSRITATARLGSGRIIDIEREAKLGGEIHSKGVMVLSSYLASRYAANRPLPLAATLVFEQSYGMVDGDSASAAELCVLLSALGNIPLKQSFAVTGSINQLGEIQAIGGVNEKIEGYFDICRYRGLSGDQGVIIPAANRVHLMLRRDIRDEVANGHFSIHTAAHVEDVMELLSGMPPGEMDAEGNFPEQSFNRRIQDRIEELQELQKQYAHPQEGEHPDSEDSDRQ